MSPALKRRLRDAYLRAMLPLARFGRRRQGQKLVVLCYHDPAPHVLDEHLRALSEHYEFVPLDHFLDRNVHLRPAASKPRLAVTFDDGWKANLALVPVLERHGVCATIFLTTGTVGGEFWWTRLDPEERRRVKALPDEERRAYAESMTRGAARDALTVEEVGMLATSVDFGAHSHTHPILTRCDTGTAMEEICRSRAEVRGMTGQACAFFAYPNGDHSPTVEYLVREAGYWAAFTTRPGFNGPRTEPTRMKRVVVRDDAPAWEAVVRASCLPGLVSMALPRALRSALQVR